MTSTPKRILTAGLSIIVIVASCWWIYFSQNRAVRHNTGLHQRIGQVLAEQTARVVGTRGRIVAIAIETREWPELKTQLDAFHARLKQLGEYEVREYAMDTRDQPKYGVGSGLSARRYVRTVSKNTNADVFVSFIGAPRFDTNDLASLDHKPRLIAESRSTDNLPGLFEHQLIDVAVVSRFQFPSPGSEHPQTPEEWFNKRYQVVTPQTAAALPKPE